MSNQGIVYVYFMQNRAELMGAVYAISESFANPMRFPKTLLEKAGIPGNYDKMSLHACIAWVNSTLPGEETLKLGVSCTHCGPTFSASIPARDRREREKRIM